MNWKHALLLVLAILLAVFYALQGVIKLLGLPVWVDRFRGWGYPDHFYLLIGAAEVLGAILLAIPGTRRYGAFGLMAVMTGAAVTHAVHHEMQIITVIVLFALLAIPAFVRTTPRPHARA